MLSILRSRLDWLVLACCLVFLSGCGASGPQPVEGKVVWKDGAAAKELAGCNIVFEQSEKQVSATGRIGPNGEFQLRTVKENDGAPVGEYKVLILEVGRKPLPGGDGTQLAPSVIDTKYATPSTSDLTASVKPGKNQITITVDRPKK